MRLTPVRLAASAASLAAISMLTACGSHEPAGDDSARSQHTTDQARGPWAPKLAARP